MSCGQEFCFSYIGDHLHSSSDVSDNDKCDNWQATIYFLLTQMSLFKYIVAVNNGHESLLREIAPAARVVHRL